MDDETLLEVNYLTLAPNRVKVLKSFEGKRYMKPSQIARKTELAPTTVSANLRKLSEKGFVYLKNPEFKSPRLYYLTEKGKKILKYLD